MTHAPAFRVSLVATVRNESVSLDRWLTSLERQTRKPDEIIIVDGGSTDGTLELLESWAATVENTNIVSALGASISTGRNIGLKRATGDIIAIIDCGTIANTDWLERLITPFSNPRIDVVSGFFVPDGENSWDRSLAASTLPDANEIDPDRFLPSSRSVAVRASWVQAGFVYPEWLDYCEDLVWDMQLKDCGARFETAIDAIVSFEVRPGPVEFFLQYYRYARGDGKAGLFAKRHVVRYATYLIAAAVILRRRPAELAVVCTAAGVHLARPLSRLLRRDRAAGRSASTSLKAIPLIPVQIVIGDFAKMIGYPVGILWRFQRFRTLNPIKNWRRISPDGVLWHPADLDRSLVEETTSDAP